ncbi:MAG: NAD(P)/FAD-dependent oxidoreductase, partial [Sulfuricellaceae bacterium]|nr:NAD(P)/FAD-dependent oxidoreductase [Sulfuricellaceae bacterium]
MAHIVILGAGIGGMPAAYEMQENIRPGDKVTVISNSEKFSFTPSNPWVAVNWRTRDDIQFPIAPYFERKNIAFIATEAKRLHPEENRIELVDGRSIDYDYLIIATGPRLAFEEIEGLGPNGHTHSICTTDHASAAGKSWEAFIKDPGPIVVGAAPLASCFGPAYEFAFIMDTDLRTRKIRNKVPITFVSSEPYVGHLGLGGVGDSKGLLESAMRERHIKWITNAKITKAESGKLFVTEMDENGSEKKQHELPFKFGMILPAFKGVDAVIGIEGLANPRGFILIDEYQRNPKYQNIYSAGVCVAIPPVEATPVPTGAPKTGYMIETMVTAAVHNIRKVLDGKAPDQKATWNA